MSRDRLRVLGWWSRRVLPPLILLPIAAILLARSRFDRQLLEPFFDSTAGQFPLRRDWFFEGVLHEGGRALVALTTLALVVGAVAGWRSVRFGAQAKRFAYLALCLLITVSIAAGWKRIDHQVTPWHTIPFGGKEPWPSGGAGQSWIHWIGSPGAHAASGFAWISLYFVGLSLGVRNRWLWLAPGVLLGLLFAFGQHVRGAHQPSHEFWPPVIAWVVAAAVAVIFKRQGWLEWEYMPRSGEQRTTTAAPADTALPWITGAMMALVGAAFFGLDRASDKLEVRYPWFHSGVEVVELHGMVIGLGVVAWLMTDKISTLKLREARTRGEEKTQRLTLLGKVAASVAHEVRNPLHTLRLIVEEQRLDTPGLKNHPLQAQLETCIERIDHAVELVYRLARPESGEGEETNLAESVRLAVAAQERLDPGRVQFEWTRPAPVAWAFVLNTAAGIVVDNLLRNAANASPQGGKVLLELLAAGDMWELRIRNQGSLHQPVESGDRLPGLGLGVSISRQIVASVGGHIEIDEEHGMVLCTLSLPRKTEAVH